MFVPHCFGTGPLFLFDHCSIVLPGSQASSKVIKRVCHNVGSSLQRPLLPSHSRKSCHLFKMLDVTYPLFPISAFLGFILSLVPLPWHLQAWNSGTCFFMMWTSLSCLNQFVNSVVWAGNVLNPAPWWCEICKCSF